MARGWPYVWRRVSWSESEILTRGTVRGLPVLSWGWARRSELATRRQLRAMGLRPGGAWPVALLMFRHRRVPGRRVEFADLFLIRDAVPKRTASPAQLVAVGKALTARRTCRECGQVQGYYLSTISRLCGPCAERSRFWESWAADRGYEWGQAA